MNIIKKYTDEMLNIALEADGVYIIVCDESVKDLYDNYFQDDSYLMTLLKSKDKIKRKLYKGIKINKQYRKLRFKNKSQIYFHALRTEYQAECLCGLEIPVAFIHNTDKIPLYDLKYLICRMRFGNYKPPKIRKYSKNAPYLYCEEGNKEFEEFLHKLELERIEYQSEEFYELVKKENIPERV